MPPEVLKGRRVSLDEIWNARQPGDFAGPVVNKETGQETWYACTPSGSFANLGRHTVEEHEDGTITVRPSILTESPRQPEKDWHGWLEHGIWRSA